MQNSSHALKPNKNEKSIKSKSTKKRKIRIKTKIIKIRNGTIKNKNTLLMNKPLYLYTDKKTFLLLQRTYYLKELQKTETLINNEKFKEEKFNLTNDEFKRLVSEFNNLLNLQNSWMCVEDLLKSLQLQNKIINILKIFIINQIKENKAEFKGN